MVHNGKQHMKVFVDDVQTAESAATGEFSRFSIRH
jgi:ribosomal protein S19